VVGEKRPCLVRAPRSQGSAAARARSIASRQAGLRMNSSKMSVRTAARRRRPP